MDHTKKMVLVSPDVLDSIGQPSLKTDYLHPVTKKVNDIDHKMTEILNSDLPIDQKMKRYSEALHHYTIFVKKDAEPRKLQLVSSTPPQTVDSNKADSKDTVSDDRNDAAGGLDDTISQEILQSVPKSMQGRASSLLRKIKSSNGELGYNHQGELVVRGQPVRGTNLVDLVNDVLRRRKNFNPNGWEDFAQGLATINAPLGLIGHPTRQERMLAHLAGDGPQPKPLATSTPKRQLPKLPGSRKTTRQFPQFMSF